MRKFIIAFVLQSLIWAGILVRQTIQVDSLERSYLLFIPNRLARVPGFFLRRSTYPLLIVLHGGGGSGQGMVRMTREKFNQWADLRDFIVVYPDAYEKHWNDGRGLEFYPSQRLEVDDVKFISQLIEKIGQAFPLNPARIYVTGMSNGGLMAYRLACELSQRIDSIAPVAAPMGLKLYEKCHPTSPVSVLIIMGTDDPIIPWNGGQIRFGSLALGEVISAEDTAEFWAEVNGCQQAQGPFYLPDKDPLDGTKVWKKLYTQCSSGKKVQLYGIEGGGHTWPGGQPYLSSELVGRVSRDVNGCEEILRFFSLLK